MIYMSEVRQSPLSFAQARQCVEDQARNVTVVEVEQVSLLASAGRVLAEAIAADRDFPPFPRATRDGYAVRAADVAAVPARLLVVARIKAGASMPAGFVLQPGECAEIMTGAPVPSGADSVVMVEYTETRGEFVAIQRGVVPGENIVPTGSEARSEQVLIQRGTRIAFPQIAVAAAVGKAEVNVYRKPKIAILSTGDEVVEITTEPGPARIRNSNSYSLAAQVIAAGGEPVRLPIAPDERGRLRQLIREGLKADMLLLSGGVSMGKYDLVEEALAEFQAEFFFTGALIQPGRPIVFGRAAREDGQRRFFFGLPGNPISTMVTFELFARAMVDALSGAAPAPLRFTQARLNTDIKTKTGLTRFLLASVSGGYDQPRVELIPWQGSGDIAASAAANCYLVIPPERDRIATGEMVSLLLR